MATDGDKKLPEVNNEFQKSASLQEKIQQERARRQQQDQSKADEKRLPEINQDFNHAHEGKKKQKDQEFIRPGGASKMEIEKLESEREKPDQAQDLKPRNGMMPDNDFQQAQIKREQRIKFLKERLQAQKDMARDQFNQSK